MSIIAFTAVLAGVNVISQIIVASSDSFGGVSGKESIIQTCVATLDDSAGLLYFWGLLNLIAEPKEGSPIHVFRWGLLHSNEQSEGQSLKVSVRTSWLHAFEKPARIARVRWKPSGSKVSLIILVTTEMLMDSNRNQSQSPSHEISARSSSHICGGAFLS